MAVFINPFTDFGFKRLFGQEDHKKILIGFLNALFHGELVFKDITYRDKEQLGFTQEDRCILYDIYCTLDDGSHVIVEMQNKKGKNFESRALYYTSKAIVTQGEKGDDWQYDLAPVIGVFFLNFHQDGLGHAFRTDFGITKTKEQFAHRERQTNPPIGQNPEQSTQTQDTLSKAPTESIFYRKLRMVFLQMPEFTLSEAECKTDLEKWTFIMKHMEKLNTIPWAAQDELYAELSKVSSVAALSPQERILYDETLRQYRDNLCMYSAAYEDGKEEGWKKGKEEIARNMLASGCSTELIMQCTGFSKEKIETLECPTE